MTVSRPTTGKYFASVLFETEGEEIEKKTVIDPKKVIGLDMSLGNFYADHEGNTPGFIRNTRKYGAQLAQAQRRLSKKRKGSQNWFKAKHNIAIVHETITNARADFNRKFATELCSKYDAVCIETLSLKGMSRALRLGKSVHDLGYAEFVTRLKQKAETIGTHIIQANQWFASSKLCNNCGYKKGELRLNERNWSCPHCGAELSSDENAGKNLRDVGLDILGLGKPIMPVAWVSAVEISVSTQSIVKQEVQRPLLVGKSLEGS